MKIALHVRKGDLVEVISGKDKGKRGKVFVVLREKQRAIVEGVNIIKKHAKANPAKGQQAGIQQKEGSVHVAKLLPIDPTTNKRTRVGHKFLTGADGRRRKVRVARASGAELDR